VPGIVQPNRGIPGFSHYARRQVNNLHVVLPFIFLITFTLKRIIGGLFKKGQTKAFFSDLFSVKAAIRQYRALIELPIIKIFGPAFCIAFLLSFIIKNPLTILLLGALLFLSVAKKNQSELMLLMAMLKVTKNIKRQTREFVNFGEIAFSVLGLACGFFIYFIFMIPIWFFFNYNIWARGIFTLLFVVLFAVMSIQNRHINRASVKAASFLTVILCGLAVGTRAAYGDDGGWTESGSDFFSWLSNPGTSIIAALGFTGGLASQLGWIGDTIAGGVSSFFGVDVFISMGSMIGGFGEPVGSMASNLEFAKAGLGALGPLGDKLGNAVGGIGDALSGKTGGNSGANSSSSANSGGGNHGGGNIGGKSGKIGSEDVYNRRKKKKSSTDEN